MATVDAVGVLLLNEVSRRCVRARTSGRRKSDCLDCESPRTPRYPVLHLTDEHHFEVTGHTSLTGPLVDTSPCARGRRAQPVVIPRIEETIEERATDKSRILRAG